MVTNTFGHAGFDMTTTHVWTAAEVQHLRDHYPTTHTRALAHQMSLPLNKVYAQAMRLGLRKSAEFMATSSKTGRILKGGKLSQATQFRAGNTPWNAGRKGWQAGGRSAETQFTTGMEPPNTLPVGSLRTITCKGISQLERKVGTTSGPNHMRWKAVHRLVWEAANGPVPKGSIVVFKTGMRTLVEANITLDKVECITRAQNAQRNHPRNKSPELAKLYQLKGAITRQVNRIAQEQTA